MTWTAAPFVGDGVRRQVALPPPPPWRTFPRPSLASAFQPTEGLTDAVNAALLLRRPLLLTGAPGSGKSTVIEAVSDELGLGPVLRWHITSRSTLSDALYRYDPLGRIHAQQLHQDDDIGVFMQLGPLGTALLPGPSQALLIDEIDKSDLDLASDLLDVLERGEFEIPELARLNDRRSVAIRRWDSRKAAEIVDGRVRCTEFPFIVMTSNGERDFPAPFLRRCIRYTMPRPTPEILSRVVSAHLAGADEAIVQQLIQAYLLRLNNGEQVAVDQLLNAVHLLSGSHAPTGAERSEFLTSIVMHDLSGG
ncbi:AAA family ATPase [Catellatospora sp. KI3]|uniref:AAA family ATPase n=1 Tax=Catellatospora sp. KI3 TaxID=3041620 RepID=UPI002482A1DC|nr:AAA family ATPase [Catellatospora sp. KI3]MDI1461017.1 AAA family ATPase [Catellatospora sp. KI3]